MQCEQGLTFTSKHLCYDLFLNHICSFFLSILVCSSICLFICRPILIYIHCISILHVHVYSKWGLFLSINHAWVWTVKPVMTFSWILIRYKGMVWLLIHLYTAIINRQSFYDNYRFFFSQCLCLTYMKYTNTTIHLDLDKV